MDLERAVAFLQHQLEAERHQHTMERLMWQAQSASLSCQVQRLEQQMAAAAAALAPGAAGMAACLQPVGVEPLLPAGPAAAYDEGVRRLPASPPPAMPAAPGPPAAAAPRGTPAPLPAGWRGPHAPAPAAADDESAQHRNGGPCEQPAPVAALAAAAAAGGGLRRATDPRGPPVPVPAPPASAPAAPQPHWAPQDGQAAAPPFRGFDAPQHAGFGSPKQGETRLQMHRPSQAAEAVLQAGGDGREQEDMQQRLDQWLLSQLRTGPPCTAKAAGRVVVVPGAAAAAVPHQHGGELMPPSASPLGLHNRGHLLTQPSLQQAAGPAGLPGLHQLQPAPGSSRAGSPLLPRHPAAACPRPGVSPLDRHPFETGNMLVLNEQMGVLCCRTGRDPWSRAKTCPSLVVRSIAQHACRHGAPGLMNGYLPLLAAASQESNAITPSEMQCKSYWPGASKQAWNYAHILPAAQRIYKAHSYRVSGGSAAPLAAALTS